jgi:solute carrier family 35, member F5
MGLTLSSDFIYVLAMLKTTPLVVTIGLSLTIPLAVVGDFVLGRPARAQVLFGAALVLISFVVVGIQSSETKVDDSDLLDRLEPALDGREEQSLAG